MAKSRLRIAISGYSGVTMRHDLGKGTSMLAALAVTLITGVDMAVLAALAVGGRAVLCFARDGDARRLFRAAFLLRGTCWFCRCQRPALKTALATMLAAIATARRRIAIGPGGMIHRSGLFHHMF